jgi:putative mRNA 3-end processing factor
MNLNFQKANPNRGDQSVFLKFTDPATDGTKVLLIDCGEGVDPQHSLGSNEELIGILITHAHTDHYIGLPDIIDDYENVPIISSPQTTSIIDFLLNNGIAAENSERGGTAWDIDAVSSQLQPAEDWQTITDGIDIRPIPVGHAVGAVGYLIDFEDGPVTRTIFCTGDFSFNSVCGNPGLDYPLPNIDILFVNTGSNPGDPQTHGESRDITTPLRNAIHSAHFGKEVLITAGGVSGIHVACLIDSVVATCEFDVDVTITGSIAKIYNRLGMDHPSINSIPNFSHPDEIVAPQTVTIAGPSRPVEGCSERIAQFIAPKDNSRIFQFTSNPTSITGQAGVLNYPYAMHPSESDIESFIKSVSPLHTILLHGDFNSRREFNDTFLWGISDTDSYNLYQGGRWAHPPWLSAIAAKRIKSKYALDSDTPSVDLPTAETQQVSLDREGLDVNNFSITTTETDESNGSTSYKYSVEASPKSNDSPGKITACSDGGSSTTTAGPTTAVDNSAEHSNSLSDQEADSIVEANATVIKNGEVALLKLPELAGFDDGEQVTVQIPSQRE